MVTVTMLVLTAPVLAGPAVAAAQPEAPSRMELDIESLEPRVITAGHSAITVTGKVTNIGDRRIDDIEVQLKRGEAVRSEKDVRAVAELPTDEANSEWVEVSGSLEPGQSAPVKLVAPVRGDRSGTLGIDQPGVYPVLVNINGQPEYGGRARLVTLSVLLPVLSVSGGPTAAPVKTPPRLTLLWPLLDDRPRLVTAPDTQPFLADDELTDSLATGGRLFDLLNSVEQAVQTNSSLLTSMCFAVDPDLLRAVQLMASGPYRFRTAEGQLTEGTGSTVAQSWLRRVQALTKGQCVIAVPYADVDLVALARSGAVDLEHLALAGDEIVAELLTPVDPQSEVLWPADGALDRRTLADLGGTGITTVLTDPARMQRRTGSAPFSIGAPVPGGLRAVPVDSLVSGALRPGASGPFPASGVAAEDEQSISVQNGIAALTYQAVFAGQGRESILIAPPRRWTARASELSVFLSTVQRLLTGKFASSYSLTKAVSAQPRGSIAGLDYTAQDTAAEIPPSISREVARINAAKRDLLAGMDNDEVNQVSPNQLLQPVQYGLLRGTSTAYRTDRDAAGRAVAEVDDHLDALCHRVTAVDPGRPVTLASGDSPIPLVVNNSIPVDVLVRIRLGATPGLDPEPIQDVWVPANGSLPLYLKTTVTRAGRFTVDVSLSTPGGTELGRTSRLEISSTSYGSVTMYVTGTAAAVLVVLVGLRIFRRIRAAHPAADPADPDGSDKAADE